MPQTTWPLSPIYELHSAGTLPYSSTYNTFPPLSSAKNYHYQPTAFDEPEDPLYSLLCKTSEALSAYAQNLPALGGIGEKGRPVVTTAPRHRLKKLRDAVNQRRIVPVMIILLLIITFSYLAVRSQEIYSADQGIWTVADGADTPLAMAAEYNAEVDYLGVWTAVGPSDVPSGILE
ncbi:hypothetical protein IAU59_004914 [Kwoniella sp. CBS 9459]